ncbi:protein FAM193B [Polypterus senegalus]|uniref:protein FAM193B n=1 Tax=Polypterus senegalus TaxID=55291 RepID=UPI00196286CB|nr:protein FAM193B [Polypterus senegalus]
MARKKSKQQGSGNKELGAGQQSLVKNPISPADASGGGGGGGGAGDTGADRLAKSNQPLPVAAAQSLQTCCLLCHRERKEWGSSPINGPSGAGLKLGDAFPQDFLGDIPGRKLADAVLGEVPLWICQSCRKSVEDEERRAAQEQALAVSLSHSTCKTQNCGNGYPDHVSSVDWDPSSFLSAHKLSGLWNSTHTNGSTYCNHGSTTHTQQTSTMGPSCHDKRPPHEAPGKTAKSPGTKVCPYSHPASQNSGTASPGSPISTSADLCKNTPKHFKTMCRRPTPPGEAFHSSEHHQHSDLAVPPNSPTGLSAQHSAIPLPRQMSSQHVHVTSSPGMGTHVPFNPLVPNLHVPVSKMAAVPDTPASSIHKPGTCKNTHIPTANTPHPKVPPPTTACSHPCNGHSNGTVAPSSTAHLPSVACRDQTCKSHKLANCTSCHPPCELEEGLGEDEDSSSERSSCASSSNNQKDGKYCDCCYCEFFGHNAPPAAPTSRNYAEIREKLRSRLTRRKEELPQRQDSDLTMPSAIDHRDVDELLDFINSTEPKPVNSAKAAKRARHKQKKKEKEKAQQCSMDRQRPDVRLPPPGQQSNEAVTGDSESDRVLEWPQRELERVNSFLTSRLEEIKNTIKDSIRASFSMYDLNLDVNDFPKKAATLDSNHLLSHINGSSDQQQIDLDLSPLTLGSLKNHLVNGREDPVSEDCSASDDVRRLNATPNLSKLIRVRTPERNRSPTNSSLTASSSSCMKNKDDCSDSKETIVTGNSGKLKKGKKQQSSKVNKSVPGMESQKTKDQLFKVSETGCSSKPNLKSQVQCLAAPVELPRSPAMAVKGLNGSLDSSGCRQLERNCAETRDAKGGPKGGCVPEMKSHISTVQACQQSKNKLKKNKNKVDKSNSSIDDVFLPKDMDGTEMDEIDREVEYFKRFCLDSAKQTRQKVAVNWSNFSLKKVA